MTEQNQFAKMEGIYLISMFNQGMLIVKTSIQNQTKYMQLAKSFTYKMQKPYSYFATPNQISTTSLIIKIGFIKKTFKIDCSINNYSLPFSSSCNSTGLP